MDLQDLKLQTLGIDKQIFSRIFAFVDFGNVNHWFNKDTRNWNDSILLSNQKLIIDIEKLADFLNLFSNQKRFYYGWHKRIRSSWHIIIKAEDEGFIKITKPIQFIRHYLEDVEAERIVGKNIKEDREGKFIEIPKSNFDVEISIDAIRLLNKYDTFCLLSADSDFAQLTKFLKSKGKKVILIASGGILHTLKKQADLYINAQNIKRDITCIKETPLKK